MATPKMVDVRELNPQQLTEVAQRYEQELQVLQGCHQELLAGIGRLLRLHMCVLCVKLYFQIKSLNLDKTH